MKFSDILNAPLFVKIVGFALVSFGFFCLGKYWNDFSGYDGLIVVARQIPFHVISLPHNFNRSLDNIAFFTNSSTQSTNPVQNNSGAILSPSLPLSESPSPAPLYPLSDPSLQPPPLLTRLGIIDQNGVMRDDFNIDKLDPDVIEDEPSSKEYSPLNEPAVVVNVDKFPVCPVGMQDYIPCLDNVEAIKKLNSTEKGEQHERYCPEPGKGLHCLVPAPRGYKPPIPWPRSRDEVWFSNVPHPRLVDDKGGQNWIRRFKDKFLFPGGGTQFIHGADHYLDQILQMVPDIAFGHKTRVVLDIGCGVASFGAYLLSRNVLPLSIAPKDVHENQVQFALERGVPAMLAALATRRLLYPSQAFELIHCSRCRIDWTRDGGILLLEVNRILRAGGYFVWAAQPVYKHEEPQQQAWKKMEDLTRSLCWKLLNKNGYIAIWRKPLNNSCYLSRDPGSGPPLCNEHDNPDDVWYANLKACISRLPDNGFGSRIPPWPERLYSPPDRLQTIKMDASMSRKELYKAEAKYWSDIVSSYIRAYHWKKLRLRNVLDMRASYGGFGAALADLGLNSWVMNVVPISGPDTLPVIYDRGLIGVAHDWCEPFDSYPRTYDLVHASGLFSIERKRCNTTSILLEMDRLLRPGGRAYIRDLRVVIDEVKLVVAALGWRAVIQDTSEGPFSSQKVLRCDK